MSLSSWFLRRGQRLDAARRPGVRRRAFLGGAGVMLGLPFLDALSPRALRAADDPVLRFLAYYVPNGIHMASWTPSTPGSAWELTPTLAALAPVKGKVMVLSGVDNEPGYPDQIGDHAAGTGAFLTATHVKKTEGADIQAGVSIDQVIAAEVGAATKIASLQVGLEGGSSGGGCDSGYSCAYARNISWASPTQPLQKIVNPGVLWGQLFGGLDPQATAEEKARRQKYRTSVLDYVREDAEALRLRLGATDRQKLDQYLTGVGELEKKIAKEQSGPACTPIDEPPADVGFEQQLALMTDLMVLAFQCDATRVVSFMYGNAGSNRAYPTLGVPEGHHEVSHHQDLQSNFDKLAIIDAFEVQAFAGLLGKLDAISDGQGGTLLDSCAVFFSSEIEDGNSHAHRNLPVLVAGSAGGRLAAGQHLVFPDAAPMASLFVSLANAFGSTITSFGDDGAGPLPGVLI